MLIQSGRRTAAGMVAALLTGLGVATAGASPAHAQAVDVTCAGTLSTSLSPGLLFTPQSITTQNSYIYTPCTSTDPTLGNGTHDATIVAVFSCVDLSGSFSGSKVISWDNGQTSTFTFNATYSTVGGQYVTLRTGFITAGEFTGDTAIETVIGPSPNPLACLAPPGITSRQSLLTLTIADV